MSMQCYWNVVLDFRHQMCNMELSDIHVLSGDSWPPRAKSFRVMSCLLQMLQVLLHLGELPTVLQITLHMLSWELCR